MIKERKNRIYILWVISLCVLPVLFGAGGFLFFHSRMGMQGAVLGVLIDLWLLVFSESIFAWMTGAKKVGMGLPTSYSRSLSESRGSQSLPVFYLISDVVPQIYLVRSLFSRTGSVFLTQGMMTLLNGHELESIDLQVAQRLRRLDMISRSGMRLIHLWIQNVSLQSELRLLDSREKGVYKLIQLLKIWICFPIRLFLSQSLEKDDLEFLVQGQESLSLMKSKVIRTKVIWKQA